MALSAFTILYRQHHYPFPGVSLSFSHLIANTCQSLLPCPWAYSDFEGTPENVMGKESDPAVWSGIWGVARFSCKEWCFPQAHCSPLPSFPSSKGIRMGEEVPLRKSIHLANFTPFFMNQASFLQLTSKLNAAHHCYGPFTTFDKNVITVPHL